MNPDSYSFIAHCLQCNEARGVSCSRAQAKAGQPVTVYAIQCDHSWTLSDEDTRRLREKINADKN